MYIVSPGWAPQPIHDKLDIVLQQRGNLKHLENNWANFAQTSTIPKTSFTPKHWNISIPWIVSYQLWTTKDHVILHWLTCLGPTFLWESRRAPIPTRRLRAFSPRNRVGGMSNSGEGGEDTLRYTPLEDDKPCSCWHIWDLLVSWCCEIQEVGNTWVQLEWTFDDIQIPTWISGLFDTSLATSEFLSWLIELLPLFFEGFHHGSFWRIRWFDHIFPQRRM